MSVTWEGHRMLMRTENTAKGPSEHKEGFGAGNIQVHCLLEHCEVGREFHPNTDVLREGGIFTVWRDWHGGVGR